jgi:hypothetical protein
LYRACAIDFVLRINFAENTACSSGYVSKDNAMNVQTGLCLQQFDEHHILTPNKSKKKSKAIPITGLGGL